MLLLIIINGEIEVAKITRAKVCSNVLQTPSLNDVLERVVTTVVRVAIEVKALTPHSRS